MRVLLVLSVSLLLMACGEQTNSSFTPPKHGKLTSKQVRMFIKVQERTVILSKKLVKKIKLRAENSEGAINDLKNGLSTMQDLMEFASLDKKAVKQLKVNPTEYQWVKNRFIEANTANYSKELEKMAEDFSEVALEAIKQFDMFIGTEKDIRKELEDAEEALKKRKPTERKAAIAHNRRLIKRYGKKLEYFEAELSRWKILGRL